MNNVLRKYKFDLLLLATYVLMLLVFKYYYPEACIAWDTNYYLDISKNLHPDIRPIGYGLFINLVYYISQSFGCIVWAQAIIYFAATYFLLVTFRKYFNLNGWLFYILGTIILIEPAGIYHVNTILSDSLFASVTILYIATLLRYVMQPDKRIYLALHGFLIYCCIEVRFIALFYAFFSIFVCLVYINQKKYKPKSIIVILSCFLLAYGLNVARNKIKYDVALFSPFSGWTQANNTIYALPDVPNTISSDDPALNDLHAYISNYMDTTSLKVDGITTDYVWVPNSPLNVIASKIGDSIRIHAPDKQSFALIMLLCADDYDRWGKYVQMHYPVAFVERYMLPNAASLITPKEGEMTDYYQMQKLHEDNWARYHTTEAAMKCRQDVYKEGINRINTQYYHIRLASFLLAIIIVLVAGFWLKPKYRFLLHTMILFTWLLYGMMLYSSWFMHRYLLPVYPLITAVLFFTILMFVSKKQMPEYFK